MKLQDTHYYIKWSERVRIRPSTLLQYKAFLKPFGEFLEGSGVDFSQFDIDHFFVDDHGQSYPMDMQLIEEYARYLENRFLPKFPSMPSTCFRALKSFFSTLKGNGLIESNPMVNATGPAFYHSERRLALTKDELQRLIDVSYQKDPFTLRYVSVILVLGLGGLRNQELRCLTHDRVNPDQGFIIVDQGQKTAPGGIQMAPMLQEAIHQYLNHPYWVSLDQKSGKGYVFVDETGKQLSSGQLIYLVSKLGQEAGLSKRVTPHVLRHTIATLMRQAGHNPVLIRRHLRHKNENTTLRYIHATSNEDRETLENWSGTKMMNELLRKYHSRII